MTAFQKDGTLLVFKHELLILGAQGTGAVVVLLLSVPATIPVLDQPLV